MDEETLKRLPRQGAHEVVGGDQPLLLIAKVESAMNLEWWRGYYAAKNQKSN